MLRPYTCIPIFFFLTSKKIGSFYYCSNSHEILKVEKLDRLSECVEDSIAALLLLATIPLMFVCVYAFVAEHAMAIPCRVSVACSSPCLVFNQRTAPSYVGLYQSLARSCHDSAICDCGTRQKHKLITPQRTVYPSTTLSVAEPRSRVSFTSSQDDFLQGSGVCVSLLRCGNGGS